MWAMFWSNLILEYFLYKVTFLEWEGTIEGYFFLFPWCCGDENEGCDWNLMEFFE